MRVYQKKKKIFFSKQVKTKLDKKMAFLEPA
jgi:hypothetical protein